MIITVIEVRRRVMAGRTDKNEAIYEPEIEVEINPEFGAPARTIFLHPGEQIEVPFVGPGASIVRKHGRWPLHEAPMR